jgi:hypothetical protein
MIKVGITGSRAITNQGFVFSCLDFYLRRFLDDPENLTLILGGAKGVDSSAELWAQENSIKTEIYLPEYDKFPPKVAPIKRNQTIVDNSDYLLAITNGSKGAAATIKMAEKKGIPIKTVKL